MGKKRSVSRERSKERTSKRLRKLEDRMEETLSGFTLMKEAILARDAPNTPVSETPELHAPINGAGNEEQELENQTPQEAVVQDSQTNKTTPKETTVGGGDSLTEPVKESTTSEEVETPWELDADGLRIFGEEPEQKEPELSLHSSVAKRWKKYLSDGLTKEVKESLFKKYPRKGKLSFEPPILNDEVSVNLKESALKRDTYFGATQKLAGSALSALAPVIQSLAPLREPEHVKNLEQVWDAAKMLIEIHRSQTVARKACILPTLSKQWATSAES